MNHQMKNIKLKRASLGLLVCLLGGTRSEQAQEVKQAARSSALNPKVDASVRRALIFLKSSQQPSGAWTLSEKREATSITSLAVLAFLACGHTPADTGPFQQTIERGIRYVVENQQTNGLLATNTINGPMYCHGISTLMLAEVVGLITDEELAAATRLSLARAVEVILRSQALDKPPEHAGGWRYQPDSRDSDLSVTGWQVIALRAAKATGCQVPAEAIDKAIAYITKCSFDGGGFGYQPGGSPNNPRTGTGTLALELCGAHRAPSAVAGAEYLLRKENAPRWSSPYFFYEAYYVPQALFQLGDKYFQPYYNTLVTLLLEHQDSDGSWLSGDGNDRTGGRSYCTSMAVLSLAVEYRYLPIYQR
jgi:hypothetical protein